MSPIFTTVTTTVTRPGAGGTTTVKHRAATKTFTRMTTATGQDETELVVTRTLNSAQLVSFFADLTREGFRTVEPTGPTAKPTETCITRMTAV